MQRTRRAGRRGRRSRSGSRAGSRKISGCNQKNQGRMSLMFIRVNHPAVLAAAPAALLLSVLAASAAAGAAAGTVAGAASGAVAPEAPAARATPRAPAQLVLVHGKILTVDDKDSTAEALAIRDGKIEAVGGSEEILRLAGPATRRIELNGRTATPGLIDSHAHIAEGGLDEAYHVRLSDVSSVAEAVKRVAAAIARLKPGEWVQGAGWD